MRRGRFTGKRRRTARPTRRQREGGQAGAEILAFGFVLLIGMVLHVANVWAIIDAKMTVTAAAREGRDRPQ